MTLGMRQKSFDAGRGWSVTALRLLALVLVLLIAAPDLGLAADFAYPARHLPGRNSRWSRRPTAPRPTRPIRA